MIRCKLYLDQQIHNVSRHLLDQDVDHPEDLCFGSGQCGGVNILLGLGIRLSRIETMNLGKQQQLHCSNYTVFILLLIKFS